MNDPKPNKRRNLILLIVFAFVLYAMTLFEKPLHSWLLGFLPGFPAWLALLFPDQSRWRWILFGIGIGLFLATFVYPLIHI